MRRGFRHREGGIAPLFRVVTDGDVPALWGYDWPGAGRREALDWFALGRLLGWPTDVRRLKGDGTFPPVPPDCRFLALAVEPERVEESAWKRLAARLEDDPLLVIARSGAPSAALARRFGAWTEGEVEGRTLRWTGPGAARRWQCLASIPARTVHAPEDGEIWATLDGAPVVVASPLGRGVLVTIGFHPSVARDQDGAATAFLVHLLTHSLDEPIAWIDHAGTVVLRMDDPGGAGNVHLEEWRYPKLGEHHWKAVGTVLRARGARVSLFYTPGWVDDGDARRGRLWVGGRFARRTPGRVHASPRVRYVAHDGTLAVRHDYVSEYRGIQALRSRGLAEVELHGYTHMFPDLRAWSRAPDRYRSVGWYRELGPRAESCLAAMDRRSQPLVKGLALLRRYFDVTPTTLVFPGDDGSEVALRLALELGFELIGGPSLGFRDGNRLCWACHVPAPYLDQLAGWRLASGLPVVGYFHDRDVSLYGPQWLADCLDGWRSAGAERFIDYRELASALGLRLRFTEGHRLSVVRVSGPPLPRPFPVAFRWTSGRLPSQLWIESSGRVHAVPVRSMGGGVGRFLVPPVVDVAPRPTMSHFRRRAGATVHTAVP